jgi:transcriptional regulator with XRE-family HTH domain
MHVEKSSLRELICSKYDTQSECARQLGWDRQKLSYIVNGRRLPSLEDTVQLAKALDVSVDVITQKILIKKSHICDSNAGGF